MMKRCIFFVLTVFLAIGVEKAFVFQSARTEPVKLDIHLSAPEVAAGQTLLVEIHADPPGTLSFLSAVRDSIAVVLRPHPVRPAGWFFALIGIPYEARARKDTLNIEWAEADMIQSRSAPLRIVSGHYPSEEIQGVDQSRVTPSSGDIRRIEQERKILAEAYIPIQNAVIMDGPFSFPVENVVVTSPYGSRRVFNGQLRSYHGGVDFRAREGTPIYAAQSGVVRLARNLFYAGNHVLIEHGMGIYTSYSHLSVIQVSEGDRVEKGQTLGLAGATGRVTAAHLHWTVNVHGVGVSPLQFAEILNKTYKTVS